MRTPREIYAHFKIMPNLQLHQLRVAAVGAAVCRSFKKPIDERTVILACLFHDMGNIIKFDLGYFPDFLEPEGLSYWQNVKDEYVARYGRDHHAANLAIGKELGLLEPVLDCIASVGFSNAGEIARGESWERKVCEYADARVGPHGVLPLEQRFLDARERYERRTDVRPQGFSAPEGEFETLLDFERQLEGQVLAETSLQPDSITHASLAPLVEELWNYPVS